MSDVSKSGTISQIVLGTAQLGMPYGEGIWKQSLMPEEEAFNILSAAWERGITALDTSPDYGLAELRIAKFLSRNPQKQFHVISKIKRLSSKINPPENFFESWLENNYLHNFNNCLSLSLLLHNEFDIFNDSLVAQLQKFAASGNIESWGLSVYGDKAAKHALKVSDCKFIQLPFGIINQEFRQNGLLKILSNQNKRLFARSVFSRGLISHPADHFRGIGQHEQKIMFDLKQFLDKKNCPIYKFAIEFALNEPTVDHVVVGADSVEQLDAWFDCGESIKISDFPEKLVNSLQNFPNLLKKQVNHE